MFNILPASDVGMASWVLRGLRSWTKEDLAYFLIKDSWNMLELLCWEPQYIRSLMKKYFIKLSMRLKSLRRTYCALKVTVSFRDIIIVRWRLKLKCKVKYLGMWQKRLFFFCSLRSVLDKNCTYYWGTTSSVLWLTSHECMM